MAQRVPRSRAGGPRSSHGAEDSAAASSSAGPAAFAAAAPAQPAGLQHVFAMGSAAVGRALQVFYDVEGVWMSGRVQNVTDKSATVVYENGSSDKFVPGQRLTMRFL